MEGSGHRARLISPDRSESRAHLHFVLGALVVFVVLFAAHRDRQNLNLRSDLGLSGWILWVTAVSAAVVSIRFSTALLRKEEPQAGGILQSLALLATIALMIVPFMASSWLLALALVLGVTFFNPIVAVLDRQEWASRGVALQVLNLIAVLGAVYFLLRIMLVMSMGQARL